MNVDGTVNVLEAVRAERPEARLLVVSTARSTAAPTRIPTPEDEPVAPVSPYGASKAAAELAVLRVSASLDVVVARPFRTIGPGPGRALRRRLLGARRSRASSARAAATLLVGDLDAERDLIDVRDVCRAYRLLLDPAVPAGPTTSPRARPCAGDVLELLVEAAGVPVRGRARRGAAAAGRYPRGSPATRPGCEAATGWRPEIPLEQTLADVARARARETAEADTIPTA